MNPAVLFFQEPHVQRLLARAAAAAAVPLSLHYGREWHAKGIGGCAACRHVNAMEAGKAACTESRMEASELALCTRMPVTYVCHLGFTCISAPALPGHDYVLTLGPYLPEDAREGIDREVAQSIAFLSSSLALDFSLPFSLDDIRAAPDGSVAATVEWLVEELARLFQEYVPREDPESQALPPEGAPADSREDSASGEPYVEDPWLDIVSAGLLFGRTREVRAALEDVMEECADDPHTRRARLIQAVSHVLESVRRLGGETERCLERLPAFVDQVQHMTEIRDLLEQAERLLMSVSGRKVRREFNPEVPKVLEKMHRDHAQELRLEDLAREAGMCPSTLTRALERLTGEKYAQLLGRIRVTHAKRLLRRTQGPVTSICSRVGIQDQSNFGKMFLRYGGTSPGKYRTRFKK